MIITSCEPEEGVISEDGQTVTFSKAGDYIVHVEGSDMFANVVTADIPVTITD